MSLAGIAAALILPGMAGLLLVAGPSALASVYLLARAYVGRPRPAPRLAPRRGRPPPHPQRQIVIDGSNAMHWKDGIPQVETLLEILERLSDMGFTPGIVFDANVGYKLSGRYRDSRAMA